MNFVFCFTFICTLHMATSLIDFNINEKCIRVSRVQRNYPNGTLCQCCCTVDMHSHCDMWHTVCC